MKIHSIYDYCTLFLLNFIQKIDIKLPKYKSFLLASRYEFLLAYVREDTS